jgi:hypothetical protein
MRRWFRYAIVLVAAYSAVFTPTASSRSEGAPPSLPPTIVLDHSIGGVAFHERRSVVEKRIGRGEVEQLVPGAFYVNYPRYRIKILYVHDGPREVVQGIETGSPRYRTPQGIHIGSTRAAVKALPGRVYCGDKSRCDHLSKISEGLGTTFQFDSRGRVSSISVGSGVLPH